LLPCLPWIFPSTQKTQSINHFPPNPNEMK
jgi:hypothetical protein